MPEMDEQPRMSKKEREALREKEFTQLAEDSPLHEILTPKVMPEQIALMLPLNAPLAHEWVDDKVVERLLAFTDPGMKAYQIVINEFFHRSRYSPESKAAIRHAVRNQVILRDGTIAETAERADKYDEDPPEEQAYQHQQIMTLTGVTVLAGRPKMGKSYLALNLALAVARGGVFASHFKMEYPGSVLYLALEDNRSRIHGRIKALLGGEKTPSNLQLVYSAPSLDDGILIEQLRGWLDREDVTTPRLIVVDVLRMVQSQRSRQDDIYAFEYGDIRQFSALAEEYQLQVLLVTHLNKSYNTVEDLSDSIMSSTGITAAVSGIWVMAPRGEERCDAELHVSGKDVPKWVCALQRIDLPGHMDWKALGNADTVIQGSAKIEILQTLSRWHGVAPTQTELREALGTSVSKGQLSKILKKLRQDGLIVIERNRYHTTQAGVSSAEIFENLETDNGNYGNYGNSETMETMETRSDNALYNQLDEHLSHEDYIDPNF